MRTTGLLLIMDILISKSACTSLTTPVFGDDAGAIRGYDPVAYQTEKTAIKGDSAYTYEFNDHVWHFSSEENLGLFRDNPQRYVPAYGGYCAYAMSKGFVVATDPQAWTVVDDKLYLNYSLGVRKTWLADVSGYVAKADANWQEKISSRAIE